MKYAVIAISGTQHQVEENQKIVIDLLDVKENEKSSTDQVLLTVNEDKVKVGTPTVKDASVEFKVLRHYQGEKLKVFKYKSKSRYRKTTGFRAQLTEIQITKINF
ncbi:MAG: 50S ribosomal protein L21 [Candidatus Shapirobacteria bacterium]|jgi:large subunit ribosomal protein L21|nr:50S ribosomal protein L21 [Candidatus Shapirobacteria bacterium]